jgi:predicted DNA-binding transcriptional regulator AlpA
MQIFTLNEVAAREKVSRKTLDRVIKRGEGPILVRLSPHRRGVLESDFQDWLNSRREVRAPSNGGEAS